MRPRGAYVESGVDVERQFNPGGRVRSSPRRFVAVVDILRVSSSPCQGEEPESPTTRLVCLEPT